MKTPVKTLLLLGLTLAPGLGASAQTPPAAPAPLVLRYKFTPGEVLRYKMTTDMTYAIPAIGGRAPSTMQTHSESVTSQTVQSLRPSDGAATLVAHIESMTMTANGQTQHLTPAQLAQVNKGNVTVMTATGQVESAKVGALTAGALPGLDMSKGFMTSTGALPAGPVKVGDTWNGTGASGMMGMQMKLASTLNGLDAAPGGPVAAIGQTYSGTFDLTAGGPQTPMHMTGLLSGTGQMHFDSAAGAVADSTSTMKADMTMALPPAVLNGAPAGTPKTIKIAMTMTMKNERLSDTPAPAPTP